MPKKAYTDFGVLIDPYPRWRGKGPYAEREVPAEKTDLSIPPKETLQDLLDLARGRVSPSEPAPPPKESYYGLARLWARFYGFRPGTHPAGRSSELYKHALAWLTEEGLEFQGEYGGLLSTTKDVRVAWGKAIGRLGFASAGANRNNQHVVAVMMDSTSAAYLRKWISLHPVWEPWARPVAPEDEEEVDVRAKDPPPAVTPEEAKARHDAQLAELIALARGGSGPSGAPPSAPTGSGPADPSGKKP